MKNFGYPSKEKCSVCGKFKNNQTEPRFLYTVCEDHQKTPPTEIQKTYKKIIFIVGLPGSGKTTFAKSFGLPILDDPKQLWEVTSFVDCLKGTGIIVDPNLCIQYNLTKAKDWVEGLDVEQIEVIYFENNPQQCLINSRKRVDKPVEQYISYLSRIYEPQGPVIPVWRD